MREKLISIIKSLDTDTLHKMLQSAGIHVGSPDADSLGQGVGGGMGGDEKVQKWGQVKIPMSEGTKRPPIVSTKDFIVKKQESTNGKPGYMCDNGGEDDMQALNVYGGD